jgi:hypothetical protein
MHEGVIHKQGEISMFTTSVAASPKLKWAAIIMILAAGAIHLALAPEYLNETPYVGALFIATAAAAGSAAIGIARGRAWAWLLGALVAGTAFVMFIESNTVGLPDLPKEWEASGFVALAVEGLFVALAASIFARRNAASEPIPIPVARHRASETGAHTTR